MKRVTHVAMIVGVLWCAAGAGPAESWFKRANELYQQECYDSAETYYRRIVDEGLTNAAVYYNLGNACFRQRKLGEAILFYERARRLNPADPDIEHNLRFARASIVDRIPEPERSFVENVLRSFHQLLPLRTQLWILSGSLVCLSVLFALGLFVSHNARLWLIYLGCLLLVGMVPLGISTGVKIYQAESTQHAVVLETAVDARNAPDGDKVLFQAHEGTTFRVRQRHEKWWLVSLPNGVSGWVRAEALGVI